MHQLLTIVFFYSFFCQFVDSNSFGDFEIGNSCPSYSSQSNLQLEKLNGIWYNLASKPFNPNLKCSLVKNYYNIKNHTFMIESNETQIDGSFKQSVYNFSVSANKYGNELFQEQEVVDKTFAGDQFRTLEARTSVIFADYDNIAVFYTCFESKHFIMPMVNMFFYVFVRNPNFDSLRMLREAVVSLKKLGIDMNQYDDLYDPRICL